MKIILLEIIKDQGKKGDIKEVKDGYGQFLINQKKAIIASESNLKQYNNQKQREITLENDVIKEMEEIKEKLEKETIIIGVKVGSQDKIFGSVSNKQIASILKEQGYDIQKNQIIIEGGLATLGKHKIVVELHKKVKASVCVELAREVL